MKLLHRKFDLTSNQETIQSSNRYLMVLLCSQKHIVRFTNPYYTKFDPHIMTHQEVYICTSK